MEVIAVFLPIFFLMFLAIALYVVKKRRRKNKLVVMSNEQRNAFIEEEKQESWNFYQVLLPGAVFIAVSKQFGAVVAIPAFLVVVLVVKFLLRSYNKHMNKANGQNNNSKQSLPEEKRLRQEKSAQGVVESFNKALHNNWDDKALEAKSVSYRRQENSERSKQIAKSFNDNLHKKD